MTQEGMAQSSGTDHQKAEQTVPTSDCLSVLADETRRELVRLLQRTDDALHVADAAREMGGGKTLYINLHHNHIPRLDNANIIDYDCETKSIEEATGYEAHLAYSILDAVDR